MVRYIFGLMLLRIMVGFLSSNFTCSFADLGYEGPKFMWFKRLSGGITVWEHLDKAVANPEWLTLFPC